MHQLFIDFEEAYNSVRRKVFYNIFIEFGGTRWHSWLRHCATSRKVAGSIPDDVIGIFH